MESSPLPFIKNGNPLIDLLDKTSTFLTRPPGQTLAAVRLVIKDNELVGLETTLGNFDVAGKSQFDLGRFLSGKRLLLIEERTNDIQLLLKYFSPEQNYYFAYAGGIKLNKENLPFYHTCKWSFLGTVFKFQPCSCKFPETCNWAGYKKSGWIEVVNEPYEAITKTQLGSPAVLPSLERIEEVFKEQDMLCRKERLYIQYFSRAGRIIGDILMNNGVATWNAKKETDLELWNEYMMMADEAIPLPLTLGRTFGTSQEAILDDRDGAHPSDLGKCYNISPQTHKIVSYEQSTTRQEDFLNVMESATEVIAWGILTPGGSSEPSHIKQEIDGIGSGVLPTNRPHFKLINKTGLDYEISRGSSFLFTKMLAVVRKNSRLQDFTYKQVSRKLYYYKTTIPLIKWSVKAVAGKLGSFSWDKHSHLLYGDKGDAYVPLKCVPDTDPIDEDSTDMVLPAVYDTGLRCQLLNHTDIRLRKEIDRHTLEYNQDQVVHTGGKSGRGGFGNFRPKALPGTKLLVLNDYMVDFEGSSHKDEIIKIFDDTLDNETDIKGAVLEVRYGLEVYRRSGLIPSQAHKKQGTIYKMRAHYPIGTNKLVGPKLTVGDLRRGLTNPGLFRYPYSDDDIKKVVERQTECESR